MKETTKGIIDRINKIIDNVLWWSCFIIGLAAILLLFTLQFVVAWKIYPLMIIFPTILLITSRTLIWTYVKGVAKLDSSKFPNALM